MERKRGPIWDGQKKSREDVLNNDGHMHGMELCEPIIIITKEEMVHVFVCVRVRTCLHGARSPCWCPYSFACQLIVQLFFSLGQTLKYTPFSFFFFWLYLTFFTEHKSISIHHQ